MRMRNARYSARADVSAQASLGRDPEPGCAPGRRGCTGRPCGSRAGRR